MSILDYQSSAWLPSLLYLGLLVVLSWRPRSRPDTRAFTILVQILILLSLLLQGIYLHDSVFTPEGFVFGFAQDLSLMAWVGLLFYWLQSWYLPIASLRLMVLVFAMLCAFLPILFPGTLISPRAVADPWLEGLPPLLTMENLLFNLIYFGFALLSLTIFSGIFFSETLFGKPLMLDHKTIFAFASWLLFGGLIVARLRVGLRGRSALRWVLWGFAALLLAYVGSRFVLEVILQRI